MRNSMWSSEYDGWTAPRSTIRNRCHSAARAKIADESEPKDAAEDAQCRGERRHAHDSQQDKAIVFAEQSDGGGHEMCEDTVVVEPHGDVEVARQIPRVEDAAHHGNQTGVIGASDRDSTVEHDDQRRDA